MPDQRRFGSAWIRGSFCGGFVVSALVAWSTVTVGFGQSAQGGPGVRTLESGQPIERELAGGQSHSYQLMLAAGQYVLAVIEQDGIDVVVQLFGPDDRLFMAFDSEVRGDGRESVSLVAGVSGRYRLSVSAKHPTTPTARYRIRVVELRVASDRDRALQQARQLHADGAGLSRTARYDEARPLIERALAIREQALGPDDPLVAEALNSLASIYAATANFGKAEPLYQRALAVREAALGAVHPDVATSLNNLATIDLRRGDYTRSEPLLQRALAIRESVLGADHPDVAASLVNLANVYLVKGEYATAQPFSQRALAINEKALGPDHPTVALSLNNLANIHWSKGDYAVAEPLYQRALAINEKALGPDHPGVALSLNNLGNLYWTQGDYPRAEPLFRRALTIRATVLGDHPDVADSLHTLAGLYRVRGDYALAEPLFQRALAIREKALGPEHPVVATSLYNLAVLYRATRDYSRAEPLLQRALAINEKALGPEHLLVAGSLDGLANLYSETGHYAKAEPLYLRALAISERAVGAEHPDVAASLHNLANVYTVMGDYAKAEPLYQRALALQEKARPGHPSVARSLANLAALHEAKGDMAQAIAFRSRASAISERNLALNIASGSERQKLAYLTALSAETDHAVSLHVRAAPHDPEARSLALTTVLRRKGRALDAMTDSIGALRGRAAPQDHALFDDLKEARARMARLVLGGPGRATPAQHRDQIETLEARVERLEAEISRNSDEFRAQAQPVTLSAIQAAIPANAVLIELYVYRPFNARFTTPNEEFFPPRYVAYILPSKGALQWVDLGEAAPIDRAVEAWRTALRDPNRTDATRLARALDRQVMAPVRKRLGPVRHLLLSPDGALNLIPFGALVDEHSRYLVESYSLTYLTSGRDLLRLLVQAPSRQGSVVVADPLFDLGPAGSSSDPADPPDGEARRSTDFTEQRFDRLPSTGVEARALAGVLPDATLLTGGDATEAAIKQVRGPRILHVATHGFFLADQRSEAAASADGGTAALTEDPLLRSGVILAGANHRRSGAAEDGILTASEVTALDLWGTKLVVLSACDTGLGEVKNGQGVYGLRRAMVLAGAQSQVISLWQVADRPTRELMVGYYTGLQQDQGRSEALRNVQLKMLRNRDRQHPYYWAAFIASGEWSNLAGRR